MRPLNGIMHALHASLKELLPPHEPPCVSIYMPMERSMPLAAVNSRLFGDLLDSARAELERGYPRKDTRGVIERIRSISDDSRFWEGPRDAIAVFASPDVLRLFDLQRRVDPLVSVADTFHLRPLIRMLEVDQRYYVLALTLHEVRMFQGDQNGVRPLDSHHIPQNPGVVSKMRLNHHADTVSDLATPDTQYPDEGSSPRPASVERFIQAVDRAVWEQFSRDSGLPLVLVADEKTNAMFRAASKNPRLVDRGSKLDPKGLDLHRLHQETWQVIEPRFREEAQQLADQFMAAQAHHRGSSELQPVAEAAAAGRVDTLLVDAAKHIPGRLEPGAAGVHVRPADWKDPHADDVLDDLAEMVLRADGAVLVLPPEMMPTTTGLAAIYRY
jgi:hypothetical protein